MNHIDQIPDQINTARKRVIFESPGSIINEEEKDITLPDNISREIAPKNNSLSGRNSSSTISAGTLNKKNTFYLRGVLQNQGINLDSANKDVSHLGMGSISVTSNVQQIDEDIIKVKNKIGIFKSLLPNKNRDQELNQIVFGMTKE